MTCSEVRDFNISSNAPLIWSVDDAWFHNDTTANILDRLGLLEASALYDITNCFTALKGNVHKSDHTGDENLLFELAKLCTSNSFGLRLCSFEYFRNNYLKANNPNTSILLDINNNAADQANREGYGISLLSDIYKECRSFQGYVCFVTGYPAKVTESIARKQNTAEKWLLKITPIITKRDIANELNWFAAWFLQKSPQESSVEIVCKRWARILKNALLADSSTEMDRSLHISIHDNSWPCGFALPDPDDFMGLYCFNWRDTAIGRPATCEAWRLHFEMAGLRCKLKDLNSTDKFNSHLSPAVITIINLIRLCKSLGVDDICLSRCSNGKLLVEVDLNDENDDVDRFVNGLITSSKDTGAINAFRHLLGGNPSNALRSIGLNDTDLKKVFSNCPSLAPMQFSKGSLSHSEIWKKVHSYEINNSKLTIAIAEPHISA